MRQEQTDEAYDYCRRVTRRASKTFYWGSMFLPPPKRRAIWAVYAFCRVVDDIVDEAIGAQRPSAGHLSGSSAPEEELEYWRRSLERIYQRGGSTPILVYGAIGDEGEGVRRRAPAEVPFSFILHILASQEVPGCG